MRLHTHKKHLAAAHQPKKDRYNFYFTYKTVHAWWDAVARGMEDAQKQYLDKGITITYEYMAPNGASAEDQTNRTIVLTAIIGSLLVLTMMSANTIWASRKTGANTRKAVSAVSSFYLDAMADHRAKTITNLINNTFEEMEQAVVFIADENVGSTEELRTIISRVKSLLGLKRFALVDEADVVYTQYTTYTGASRHPFLSDEKLHDHTINTVSPYGSSKQLCLAIPTPSLSIMGKPFKACFVQLDIADIVNLLAFDDQGRTPFGNQETSA